jgi:hypothetical protein
VHHGPFVFIAHYDGDKAKELLGPGYIIQSRFQLALPTIRPTSVLQDIYLDSFKKVSYVSTIEIASAVAAQDPACLRQNSLCNLLPLVELPVSQRFCYAANPSSVLNVVL